jgi:DNA helicase-2/ATP-dependent DNA helicase PcrA
LEAVARQIGVLSDIGSYNGQILYDRENGRPTSREKKSIQEAIRDGVLPVLDGSVELEEDLLPVFPRDRIAVLSIHQSKGLEFPVVIVDVGAAFKINHHGQKFKRFPEEHSAPQQMEDRFRPFSSLGLPQRNPLDRTFDDLIRQYFVAFSRPESVLILVGTKKSGPNGTIMNVATGWDRDENQQWSGTAMIEEV